MQIKIGNKKVSKKSPTYFIAEVGVNHNGDLNLAKKMIRAAKKSGANAVKFQTFKAETLCLSTTPKVKYQKKNTPLAESHFEMIKSLELSKDSHMILLDYCKKNEIHFLSTPYDVESAKFLNKIGCDTFKTASADIVDLKMHNYLAGTGKTVIISTGMANLQEIRDCVQIYRKKKNKNFILLHCVSSYPCSKNSLNMNVLPELAKEFDCLVGYSDHSIGHQAAEISIILGGVLIEKHFTIDKNLSGPDQQTSILPEEYLEMVQRIHQIKKILGDKNKICQNEEIQMSKVSRKSLTLNRSIAKGEKLMEKHVTLKRPGTGIFYKDLKKILGLKAKKSMKVDHQITLKDFE